MKRTDYHNALKHLAAAKCYIDQNRDPEFQAMHDALDHIADVLEYEWTEDFPEHAVLLGEQKLPHEPASFTHVR